MFFPSDRSNNLNVLVTIPHAIALSFSSAVIYSCLGRFSFRKGVVYQKKNDVYRLHSTVFGSVSCSVNYLLSSAAPYSIVETLFLK